MGASTIEIYNDYKKKYTCNNVQGHNTPKEEEEEGKKIH